MKALIHLLMVIAPTMVYVKYVTPGQTISGTTVELQNRNMKIYAKLRGLIASLAINIVMGWDTVAEVAKQIVQTVTGTMMAGTVVPIMEQLSAIPLTLKMTAMMSGVRYLRAMNAMIQTITHVSRPGLIVTETEGLIFQRQMYAITAIVPEVLIMELIV